MPYKDPYKARSYSREALRKRRASNPAALTRTQRRHYANNRDAYLAKYDPRKAREYRLIRLYGLTLAAWEALFDGQGRKCAVCESTDPRHKRGWHTDHDHTTGKIRGILCHECNVLLGRLGDNAEGVRARAAAFLEYLDA